MIENTGPNRQILRKGLATWGDQKCAKSPEILHILVFHDFTLRKKMGIVKLKKMSKTEHPKMLIVYKSNKIMIQKSLKKYTFYSPVWNNQIFYLNQVISRLQT